MPRKANPHVQSYKTKFADASAITPIEYGGLQTAFDHFNAALFDGALPDVFITYQRKANSAGYFLARPLLRSASASSASTSSRSTPMVSSGDSDEQIVRRWCTRWHTSGSTRTASLVPAAITTRNGPRR